MKQEELKEIVLKARAEGKVVMWVLPDQLMTAPVEEFVQQPADGILYDLNRLEECVLSDGGIRWVNDFAVALTIRELVRQRDNALGAIHSGKSERAAEPGQPEPRGTNSSDGDGG